MRSPTDLRQLNNERLDELDLSLPDYSARTKLFALEPLGIGTPFVESLPSYFSRIAEDHHVVVKLLVRLLPSELRKEKRNKLFGISGLDATAKDCINGLESLTGMQNLRCMTMLTWRGVLPRIGLLKDNLSWCPACFAQDNVPYLRLLWALKAVHVCPVHRTRLRTMFPNCHATSPRIAGKTRPGFCFQCNRWLGETGSTVSNSSFSVIKTEILEENVTIANLAGKLLIATHDLIVPTGKPVAKALKEARKLNKTPDGVCMYRTLGILGSTYNTWINPGNKPSLSSVLDMCVRLDVSPVDLLTKGTFGNMKFWNKVKLLPKPESEKKRERRVLDIPHIRHRLELIASSEGTPPTLMQVSRSEQIEHSILRRHFPDLCKKITQRARIDRAALVA